MLYDLKVATTALSGEKISSKSFQIKTPGFIVLLDSCIWHLIDVLHNPWNVTENFNFYVLGEE